MGRGLDDGRDAHDDGAPDEEGTTAEGINRVLQSKSKVSTELDIGVVLVKR